MTALAAALAAAGPVYDLYARCGDAVAAYLTAARAATTRVAAVWDATAELATSAAAAAAPDVLSGLDRDLRAAALPPPAVAALLGAMAAWRAAQPAAFADAYAATSLVDVLAPVASAGCWAWVAAAADLLRSPAPPLHATDWFAALWEFDSSSGGGSSGDGAPPAELTPHLVAHTVAPALIRVLNARRRGGWVPGAAAHAAAAELADYDLPAAVAAEVAAAVGE